MTKEKITEDSMTENAARAASRFFPSSAIARVRTHGEGNINRSYQIRLMNGDRFLLQRLNPSVFPDPSTVMHNLRLVLEHLHRKSTAREDVLPGWRTPRLVIGREGRDYAIDEEGAWWRAMTFLDNTTVLRRITDTQTAGEIGAALGGFHDRLADLPVSKLGDPLPGFHDTSMYLAAYDRMLTGWAGGRKRTAGGRYCERFVSGRRYLVDILEKGRRRGILRQRVVHGDPKVDNFLLGADTGRVVSLIDLDTVMAGLLQYDLGDCLRSSCNPLGEDREPGSIRFETDICRALLAGYVDRAARILTTADIDYVYHAVLLLAFELGLRFYTDYLAGNVYFHVRYREHNLDRALVQFHLAEDIEGRKADIRALVRDLRGRVAG